jgi:hypothetical protein
MVPLEDLPTMGTFFEAFLATTSNFLPIYAGFL